MEQFDTKSIQWKSVCHCMVRYFVARYDVRRNAFVSVRTDAVLFTIGKAITLHNESDCPHKIVERAKLQWCKRKKKLICQSHLVKFVKSKDAIAQ